MKPLTEEWVSKAEDDYVVAVKMFRARKKPVYDAVCYHAQQCAEKYLKAVLQEYDYPIPRTHKLLELLKLVKQVDVSVEILLPDLLVIDQLSVNIRYPGISADKEEAKMILTALKPVRASLQRLLGIG